MPQTKKFYVVLSCSSIGLKLKNIAVSYHDICEQNYVQVQSDWESLSPWMKDVQPALMVVPNPAPEVTLHSNFKPSSSQGSPEGFRDFVLKAQSQGSLIFQHGLNHWADKRFDRSYSGRMILKSTHNEAEFAGLAEEQSAELLELALLAWSAAELPASDGFVPPTWHAPKHLVTLARQFGYKFYESRTKLYDFESKTSQRILPMSFWGDSEAEFKNSLKQNYRLFKWASLLGFKLRIALHPSDFQGSKADLTLSFIQNLSKKVQWTGY